MGKLILTPMRERISMKLILSAALAALFLVSNNAQAQTVTGCLKSGKLKHVAVGTAPAKPCKPRKETEVTFGAQGPKGDDGTDGADGADGSKGDDGADMGQVIGEVLCDGLAAEGVLAQIPGYPFNSYTDREGAYRLFYVPEGTYDLSIGTASQGVVTIPDVQVFANETATVNPVDICTAAPPTTGENDASSGLYATDPDIGYVCSAFGFFEVVNVNITEFDFQVIGTSLTIVGAPVTMAGLVDGSNFEASGSIAGDVTETYALTGTFTDADSWTGVFTITFVGDTSQTDCSDQQFNTGGARIP